MDRIAALFDWLVDGAPGAPSAQAVVERLGVDLPEAIPLDRIAAFVRTLHPHVLGRSFIWTRESGSVRVGELTMEKQRSDAFRHSPAATVMVAGVELRRRLVAGETAGEYQDLQELARAGFTDYVCEPLLFLSGQRHAIAFATKSPGGFQDEHLAAIRHVLRPLARVAEILALQRTAANLLSTYVGRNAGERILAGRILKGDIETVRAIIWFSDLRGFTEMSARMTPRATIDTLNELFDCQVTSIERHGGEVLKFMGDGLLALFPFATDDELPRLCTAALDAADEAFAALSLRNDAVTTQRLRFGVALHVGDVAYGNIGGASRLDFTAIGPAVNLASRLEGLTGKLGRPVIVSEELSRHASRPMIDLGAFELKGIAGSVRVFATDRTTAAPRSL